MLSNLLCGSPKKHQHIKYDRSLHKRTLIAVAKVCSVTICKFAMINSVTNVTGNFVTSKPANRPGSSAAAADEDAAAALPKVNVFVLSVILAADGSASSNRRRFAAPCWLKPPKPGKLAKEATELSSSVMRDRFLDASSSRFVRASSAAASMRRFWRWRKSVIWDWKEVAWPDRSR